MGKKIVFVLWIVALIAVFLLLGGYVYNLAYKLNDEVSHPEVTFEIENYGTVKMELYPEYAPNTVANIIKLVEKGYYNNKIIYGKDEMCMYVGRTAEGKAENPKLSLIQDGVEKDYEYTIPGEFVANGYMENTLRHEKGVVTLIRNDYTQYVPNLTKESYNSGNAQIGFIMDDQANSLNGSYAAFGKITEGMEIVEKIFNEAPIAVEPKEEGEETSEEAVGIQKFETAPVVKSATVDTHGNDFGMPVTEKAFDYQSYMYDLMTQYYGGQQ